MQRTIKYVLMLGCILNSFAIIGMDRSAFAQDAQKNAESLGRSELHVAAFSGDQDRLKREIERLTGEGLLAPALKNCDIRKKTPLHYAVKSGVVECVKLLLAAGANPNVTDTQNYTPLDCAVMQNHQDMVNELLKNDICNLVTLKNALPKTVDIFHQHTSGHKKYRTLTAQGRKPETIADPILLSEQKYQSMRAISNHIVQSVRKQSADCSNELVEETITLDSNAYVRIYPLHAAAQEVTARVAGQDGVIGNREQITRCLRKYTVDSVDHQGNTALLYAVSNNYPDSVQCLLENGAQLQLDRALFVAAQMPREDMPVNPNMRNPTIDLLKRRQEIFDLLIGSGANINAKNGRGDTLLHIATRDFQEKAVEGLVNTYHANIYEQNAEGDTILHIAVSNNDHTMKRVIDALETNVRTSMDAKTKKKYQKKLVQITNYDGQTPENIAANLSDSGLLKSLIRGKLEDDWSFVGQPAVEKSTTRDLAEDKPDFSQPKTVSAWALGAARRTYQYICGTGTTTQTDTGRSITTATPITLTRTTATPDVPLPKIVENVENNKLPDSKALDRDNRVDIDFSLSALHTVVDAENQAQNQHNSDVENHDTVVLNDTDLERLSKEHDAQPVHQNADLIQDYDDTTRSTESDSDEEESDIILDTTQPVTAVFQDAGQGDVLEQDSLKSHEPIPAARVRVPRVKSPVPHDQQADNFHLIFSEQDQMPAVLQQGNNPDPKLGHSQSLMLPIMGAAVGVGLVCLAAKKLYEQYYPEDTDECPIEDQQESEGADTSTEAVQLRRAL